MRINIVDGNMGISLLDADSVDSSESTSNPDVTLQADSELAQKILSMSRFKCVLDDLGNLIDVEDAGPSLQEQIDKVKSELQDLDQRSVRSLREILSQVISHVPGLSNLPGVKFLDDYESQSETLRSKLNELTAQMTTSKEN